MGTYAVRKKSIASPSDNIVSPGVQTCLVVVLESAEAIAVAHIDSPLVAAQITAQMADEMKAMGSETMKARIYGGDYGNPLTSSSCLSNPIYTELNKRKISYSHNDYQLTSGFVMATATAIWSLSSIGPESWLLGLLCVGLAYKASDIVKAIIPEQWQPNFLASNLDVSVNITTGTVRLVKDNEANSKVLLSEARNSLFHSGQWGRLQTRASLNPIDSRNRDGLEMLKV